MGNPDFAEFDSLYSLDPDSSYDELIISYLKATGYDSTNVIDTPWTSRALGRTFNTSAAAAKSPLKPGRKYKPVVRKVKPVPTTTPDPVSFQLKPIPPPVPTDLPFHPIDYHELPLGKRITMDRLKLLLGKIKPGTLTEEETNLIAFVIHKRELAFAFDYAEKGFFSREYYPDYKIPTIEHVPWQSYPIRIPDAILQDVKEQIQREEKLGRFEPTVSSYRSSMFAVAKKPGSVPPVQLVINLEPLNAVTVRDSAMLPNINEFAESFIGYAMYGLADMFSGFDARHVHPESRPLQAFHTPNGPKQQCTLVQGYTNAPQEFCRCAQHAMKPLPPDITDSFIDDSGIKGPRSRYNNEAIPENPGIRRFVWEYIQNFDLFLGAVINAGITVSGLKTTPATLKLQIVGTIVSYDGWIYAPLQAQKVIDYPYPKTVSEVRGFLGVAGGGRRWIKGFALIAKPLTELTRASDAEFILTDEAKDAVDVLKKRLSSTPVLVKIDYQLARQVGLPPRTSDEGLIIVGVDGSYIGAGWAVYQVQEGVKRVAIYGGCTFSGAKQNYGQPKTEVYALYRAL